MHQLTRKGKARHRILRISLLQAVEMAIDPFRVPQEFRMAPLLGDLAALHDDNAVGVPDSRQAMGNDKDGPVGADPSHIFLDDPLGFIVKGTGGLVEDQDTRVGDQRPGNGNALPLAAGQTRALLSHLRIVAFRQFRR